MVPAQEGATSDLQLPHQLDANAAWVSPRLPWHGFDDQGVGLTRSKSPPVNWQGYIHVIMRFVGD